MSRSAARPLKLALFPVPQNVSIGQQHSLWFLSVLAKNLFIIGNLYWSKKVVESQPHVTHPKTLARLM